MGNGTDNLAAALRARSRARRAKTLADKLEVRREVEEALCDAALEVCDAHQRAENAAANAYQLEEEIGLLDEAHHGARDPKAAVRARAAERIADLAEEAQAAAEEEEQDDDEEQDEAADLVDPDLADAIADVKLAETFVLVLVDVRARLGVLDAEAAEEAITLAADYADRADLEPLVAERRIVAIAAPLMRRAYEQTVASFPRSAELDLRDVQSTLQDLVLPLDE
jgi:hypothetical protein